MRSGKRVQTPAQKIEAEPRREVLRYNLVLKPLDRRRPLIAASKVGLFVAVMEGTEGASTLDEYLPAIARIVTSKRAGGSTMVGWTLEVDHVIGAVGYRDMEEIGRDLLRRLVAADGDEDVEVRAGRPGAFLVEAIPLTEGSADRDRDRVMLGDSDLAELRTRMKRAVESSGLSYENLGVMMGASPSRNPANVAWKFVHKSPDPGLAKLASFAKATATPLVELLPPGLTAAGGGLTSGEPSGSQAIVDEGVGGSGADMGRRQGAIRTGQESEAPALAMPPLGREVREVLEDLNLIAERTVALIGGDYRTTHRGLDEVGRAFREIAAQILQPHFNLVVKSTPQETYKEKQLLCKWINAELGALGLAIKCPGTQIPGLLSAGIGANAEIGRFDFIADKENPKTGRTSKQVVVRRNYLPDPIELMPSARLARAPKPSNSGLQLD
ncbi:hypothetical protein [Paludisphaera mucosa]|uniref:Uncharacterized protein n=1 Tax=Paludisphaera mucosa TaxID=3030827 RepID=A0ABT6FLL3_9BACT|nr:hypothetical protein [Paludisphaera mucosa]MDG3008468.1 hypothetical protein [Paludisphaera mucosa]